MWGGVRGWGRAQLQWLVRGLEGSALAASLSSGGLCTDQDRLTVRAKWSKEGDKQFLLWWRQTFPPVASKLLPPNLVSCYSFNEVTAAAAGGWQISRIKVGKRSRGQMERVELYWPKTQTMFLMNFRGKHTSLSLIIHSAGTVHLNRWPAAAAQKWKGRRNGRQ